MSNPKTFFHIGISSVYFDCRPEGICTGRLIRVLLDGGHRVTLYTSDRSKLDYTHKNLTLEVHRSRPRYPRAFLRLYARLRGYIENNFFIWSRSVIKKNTQIESVPDLFYARAWPHASWAPAYHLAKIHEKPLVLHLSDPFPPPYEPSPGKRFLDNIQLMADRASALTFTNSQTIDFQKHYLNFSREKAFVLPHVYLEQDTLPRVARANTFYYIGSINKTRPINPLLKGFSLFVRKFPEAKLVFVGASKGFLLPFISQYKLDTSVEFKPFTNDVKSEMANASCLIAYDKPVEHPIYLTTKIVEYLNVDRPVLAITPENSPVDDLIRRHNETAISVNSYEPQAVAEGFRRAQLLTPTPEQYRQRFKMMAPYLPEDILYQTEKVFNYAIRQYSKSK